MNGLLPILLIIYICSIQGGMISEDNESCTELGGQCVISTSNCQKIIDKARCLSSSKCCATQARLGWRKGEKLGKEKTPKKIKTEKKIKTPTKIKTLKKIKTPKSIKTSTSPKGRKNENKLKKIDNGKVGCDKTAKRKCAKAGGTCKDSCNADEDEISKGCKEKGCKCCALPDNSVECDKTAKRKCAKAGGTCKDSCNADEDEISKGCKEKGCKCCVPPDNSVECGKTAKRKCTKAAGTCKDSCNADENVISKGCKGKGCKCCVPPDDPEPVTCKIKLLCSKKGGSCVTNRDVCDGELLSNGCDGKGCLCCAPTSTMEITTTVSPLAKTVQCGIEITSSTRIVGGVEVTPIRKYSWHVGIDGAGKGTEYYCGGSIITNKHILTAAYCFYDFYDSACTENIPSPFYVGIGDHHMITTPDNLPNSIHTVLASQVSIHESYDCERFSNDIAIIELSESLDLLENMDVLHPVCLPKDTSKNYEEMTATVSGWGVSVVVSETSSQISFPFILQEVQLPVLSNTDCSTILGVDITQQQLCTAVLEGGKGPCIRDSGSPLTVKENGQYAQIGVVSNFSCAAKGNPDVYTRVTNYLDWIKDNVGSEKTYSLP